jgi:hypothetical protein
MALPSLSTWSEAPNRLLGLRAPLAMTLKTPSSRVASLTIFELSRYLSVANTIAGVDTTLRVNPPGE